MSWRHCIAAALCLIATSPSPAVAQSAKNNKAEARKLALAGGAALDAKRYEQAIEKLRAAERLFHAPTHVQMMGEALEGLGRLVEALELYQQQATEFLPQNAPRAFKKAQQQCRERIAVLVTRVPSVMVMVEGPTPNKVRITVDQRDDTLKPEKSRFIDPGSHEITVEAKGYQTVTRQIDVPEGADVNLVKVRLEVATPEPLEPVEPDEPEGPPLDLSPYVPAFVAFGVGAAGLAVGGVTGAMSLGKVSDLEQSCPSFRCPPEQQSDIDSAETLGTVSTIGFIVGGAGVAAGAVLLFWNPWHDSDQEAATALRPWLGPGSAGVNGTF
jgi:hypothetical protein